jgi:hypothetical protein
MIDRWFIVKGLGECQSYVLFDKKLNMGIDQSKSELFGSGILLDIVPFQPHETQSYSL